MNINRFAARAVVILSAVIFGSNISVGSDFDFQEKSRLIRDTAEKMSRNVGCGKSDGKFSETCVLIDRILVESEKMRNAWTLQAGLSAVESTTSPVFAVRILVGYIASGDTMYHEKAIPPRKMQLMYEEISDSDKRLMDSAMTQVAEYRENTVIGRVTSLAGKMRGREVHDFSSYIDEISKRYGETVGACDHDVLTFEGACVHAKTMRDELQRVIRGMSTP